MRTFLQWFCGTYLVLLTIAVGVVTHLSMDFGDELGWQTGHLKSGDFIMLWLVSSFIAALVIFARVIKAPPSSARAPAEESLSPRSSPSPHTSRSR
jgi:hypothetical protein